MKKTFYLSFKVFQIAFQANGVYAILSVLFTIYEATFYPLIQVILLARVLDLLQAGKLHSIWDLSSFIGVFIVASVLKIAVSTFLDTKMEFYNTKIDGFIDYQISKKLAQLDPATFENSEFQDLLAQIEGVKGTIQMQIIRSTKFIDVLFSIGTATVVIGNAFPWFAPLLFLGAIPSFLVWHKFRKDTWVFYVEKRSIVTRVTQYIKNLLSQDSTSKESLVFRTGDILLSKIKRQQKTYYTSFDKATNPGLRAISLARIFHLCLFLYTQFLTVSAVIAKTLSIGQFALYFQQTLNLAYGTEEILNQYSSMSVRNKYLEKYFELMSLEKKIVSPKQFIDIPKTPTPPTIEFRDVSFMYPGTERFILKNFNITITSGEKIALVGENGAGKTTLIKLLLRFYDVTSGAILINGIDIKELSIDEWHGFVGALFQDFIRYQFTVSENITLGDLSKRENEDALEDAMKKSGADEILKNLPDGINQTIGKMFEGGVDLSGGQWQKLALARAFFRDAPILILDEPTSAIDAKAEYEIFEKVQKLQKNKTVIIISHRFSTVRNADRILVLEEGKIVEEGSHEKLMKQKGLYAELFTIQAKGYK